MADPFPPTLRIAAPEPRLVGVVTVVVGDSVNQMTYTYGPSCSVVEGEDGHVRVFEQRPDGGPILRARYDDGAVRRIAADPAPLAPAQAVGATAHAVVRYDHHVAFAAHAWGEIPGPVDVVFIDHDHAAEVRMPARQLCLTAVSGGRPCLCACGRVSLVSIGGPA